MWGDIVIAFLLACMTAYVITPYTIRLARKLGAVDKPEDERRVNKKEMPRLGRLGSGFWFYCINYIFSYNNVN